MKKCVFLLLFIPNLLFAQQIFPYQNLVLEGGGVRGLAYAGALEVLEEKNVLQHIERVAGSSAGAIAGLMIAVGYNSHEIDSVFENMRIQQFNDGKDIFGKIKRVARDYGLFKGDKFERWLGTLINAKTGNANTTFQELHDLHLKNKAFKEFYCTGTNITRQELEIFSFEKWPHLRIKTAVRISGSIPFYFKPVVLDTNGNEITNKKLQAAGEYFVDGGMLCNYPINIFDSATDGRNTLVSNNLVYNSATLGLKLERAKQVEQFENKQTSIAPYEINSLKDYTSAVMNLMMEKLGRSSTDLANERGRTIYISYDEMSGRPKKISAEQKKLLFENGSYAANEFFNQLSTLK